MIISPKSEVLIKRYNVVNRKSRKNKSVYTLPVRLHVQSLTLEEQQILRDDIDTWYRRTFPLDNGDMLGDEVNSDSFYKETPIKTSIEDYSTEYMNEIVAFLRAHDIKYIPANSKGKRAKEKKRKREKDLIEANKDPKK
eukprot:UN32435